MRNTVTSPPPETVRCGFCWMLVILFLLGSLLLAGWLYLRGQGTAWLLGDYHHSQVLSAYLQLPLYPQLDSTKQAAHPARSLLQTKASSNSPTHTNPNLSLSASSPYDRQDPGRIRALENQLVAAVQTRQLEETTNRLLRGQLLSLENKLEEAKQRLLVYEELFSDKKFKRGLRVQNFSLHLKHKQPDRLKADQKSPGNKVLAARAYRYHLVLINAGRDGTPVKGGFEIMIPGWDGGNYRLLVLADLRKNSGFISPDGDQKFVLKYYQSFEGDILLPDGFLPEGVIIELYPGLKRKKPIVRRYDWATLQPSDTPISPVKQE